MSRIFLATARAAACLSVIAASSNPAFACSSCGCNLTSDWLSQNLIAQPGTTISIRYDFVPQTVLRSGRTRVNRATIALPADREIEQSTHNHYMTASFDHAFDPVWAINVELPFVIRPHRTIAEGETDESSSRTNGLGDVRASVRFQGFGGAGITGVQVGLKLPTGAFRQRFRTGPDAGNAVDRGLQPGSGTIDALLGIYHFGKLGKQLDYLLQVQGEVPLTNRDLYRPGAAATLSAGVHYTGFKDFTPQLNVNLRVAGQDHGANSDRANSGGEHLYAAPGFSARMTDHVSAFGYVQLPLYERVNGYQLIPPVTLSAGVQYRF